MNAEGITLRLAPGLTPGGVVWGLLERLHRTELELGFCREHVGRLADEVAQLDAGGDVLSELVARLSEELEQTEEATALATREGLAAREEARRLAAEVLALRDQLQVVAEQRDAAVKALDALKR